MQNYYFGKLDNSFILYLDPYSIDLFNFSKKFSIVSCNEIIFDDFDDFSLNNIQFSMISFIEKIKDKTITEFDVVFDDKIHIQNVWWDDILIICDLDKMAVILNDIRNTMSNDNIKYLEISLQSTNNFITSYNNRISKRIINPNDFLNFIINSDRYQDKERKFFY
jgi:hypothetical protein